MNKGNEHFRENELPSVFRKIKESDLPSEEKLAEAFDWMTSRMLEFAKKEIELTRALKDEDALIREQIKYEMTKSARDMFQDCFRAVLGRKAWE
jgi:hypothetical protein